MTLQWKPGCLHYIYLYLFSLTREYVHFQRAVSGVKQVTCQLYINGMKLLKMRWTHQSIPNWNNTPTRALVHKPNYQESHILLREENNQVQQKIKQAATAKASLLFPKGWWSYLIKYITIALCLSIWICTLHSRKSKLSQVKKGQKLNCSCRSALGLELMSAVVL